MSHRFVLGIALAGQLASHAGAAAATYTAPAPGTIERLERDRSPREWFIVTTDSMRLRTRIGRFDAVGLAGLRPGASEVRPRDPLPWTQVERVSVQRSRRTRGVFLGVLVGGVGTTALARSGDFFFAGALAGGALGGVLGRKAVHEEDLYRARHVSDEPRAEAPIISTSTAPPPDSAVVVAEDSLVESVSEARSDATASGSNPPADEVDVIARLILPRDRVRVHGRGGVRIGYVGNVSAAGLDQFRPKASSMRSDEPGELIRWEDIEQIDRRTSRAGKAAKSGAIGLGMGGIVLGALIGGAVSAIGQGRSNPGAMVAGGALGGLTLGALGGLLGAGVGSAVRGWEPVYRRR